VAAMLLHEWRVARRRCSESTPRWSGVAAGLLQSCRKISPAGAAEQPEAATSTGSCCRVPHALDRKQPALADHAAMRDILSA